MNTSDPENKWRMAKFLKEERKMYRRKSAMINAENTTKLNTTGTLITASTPCYDFNCNYNF